MSATSYVIRFDFPDGLLFAGLDRGAWAFAPTLTTAHLFADAHGARRVLDNGYGTEARKWARVMAVDATVPS